MSLGQKFTYRNKKILDHARGQACTNCGREDGTVVAAHSNDSRLGKGRGIKAHDIYVAFLDSGCHSWLDSGSGKDPSGIYDNKHEMWQHAHDKTLLILLLDEVIK